LHAAENFSQNIEIDFDGDIENFETDRKKFRQITYNLLSNALKFSNEEDSVKILFAEKERIYKLTIEDRGCGIHPSETKKIFEPFHRGINAGGTQGTGLGMAIVDKYIKALGAEIDIDSKEGAGTSVTVTFH
jgi:signal transduction histidine kinase